jgi:hypothetical protein
MPKSFRRSVSLAAGPLVPALLLLCALSLTARQAIAQDTPAPRTAFEKQLDRIDFAITGVGIITSSVSGIEKRDADVTASSTSVGGGVTTTTDSVSSTLLKISPSSTAGELFTLRYIAKPFVGFEYNFGNARYTQNYAFTTTTTAVSTYSNSAPPTTTVTTTYPSLLAGGAQNTARELTLGYVAHLHKFYGIVPYAGAGGGTIHFTPTGGGGQGLPFQYRAVYYYNLGLETMFTGSADHIGVRLGFRQLIYLAPDFGQNYLTITRRAVTSEPTFGFFLRF